MITFARLRKLLHYDATVGVFRWIAPDDMNTKKVGSVAGWHSGKKARRIEIDRKNYLAHRLAWLYVFGKWPKGQIDHINGDRSDNRISNLREADNSQNQANMSAKSNNRLGIRGVSFRKGKYIVQLRKQTTHVRAYFNVLENAKLFAEEVSKALHGEFSIHNR